MKSDDEVLQAALSFLPHGPEFRFVDQLRTLIPGKEGVGEYRVRGDEPFLRGHFPGDPLFPGVLLVEAAAQLAGVVAQSDPAIPPMRGLKLTALRAVKILGTARPAETFRIEAKVLGRLGKLIQAQAVISVGNQVVLQADMTLSADSEQTSAQQNI